MLTDAKFEAFLARVYVEEKFRKAFLENPRAAALQAGLTEEQAEALRDIDRPGLHLAARSFESKRKKRGITAGH